MRNDHNSLLTKVMVHLRRDRPFLDRDQTEYVRIDRSMGGRFAQLWFLTRGCTWDRRGACTMCNYGVSRHVASDEMVEFVRAGLDSIVGPVDELYASPSGSLLDPIEVPPEARDRILALVNEFDVAKFSFETRAETISEDAVQDLIRLLPGKRIAVGFGLESANAWVLRYCINKPDQPAALRVAARLLREVGIEVYANVSLGPVFLTASESIADTVNSVEWALANGADIALVFPTQVKPFTLPAWLLERGRYRPPSLWSLIEVLNSIDASLVPRVTISWYRSDYGEDPGVIASPTTCPVCEADVLAALDRFRADPSPDSVSRFDALSCACRIEWRRSVDAQPELSLPDRVIRHYETLVREFRLEDWWIANADSVTAGVTQRTGKTSS